MADQLFKGDELELKFYNSLKTVFDTVSAQKDLFNEGAYTTYALGEMIWDAGRAPLTNAIVRNIFREAFPEIVQAFIEVGTFEAYLSVFRKIFGDDVDVEFTVPAPGKLGIDIVATGLDISDFIARYISGNDYYFDEVVDHENDNIAFQGVKGFQTQYEVEQMLFEMVPDGIYTTISLTIG